MEALLFLLIVIGGAVWINHSDAQRKQRECEEREIIARGREEEKRRKDAEAIADAIVRRQREKSDPD